MGNFSNTQEIDNPTKPCEQGNIFLNKLPLGAPALSFSVNGESTGALPTDLIFKLENTLPGTTSRLTFQLDGQPEITLIEDLDLFTRSKPEDTGAIVDQVSVTPYQPQGRLMEYAMQTTSRSEAEDVLVLEIDHGSVPVGEHDVDQIDDALSQRISRAILDGLEAADRMTQADDLLAWSRENLRIGDTPILIDFTTTGTDGPPMIAEVIATISYNRRFLIEALHQQSRKVKVWTSGVGRLLMSFRYSQPARGLFQGLIRGVMSKQIANISAGATQSLRPLAANVAKKLPLIGVAIVAGIDVVQHFAKPEAEREWNALFASLFVDIGAVIVGGIVGGILAGIAIAALGLVGAPLAVIGVGIAMGIAVGVALTSLADRLQLEAKVKEALDGFAAGLESFAEKLADYVEGAVEAVDEFLNEANPGDGRITGPTDYIMEVHTGLDRYIGWRF